MRKIIMSLLLVAPFSAKAGILDSLDYTQLFATAGAIAHVVEINLEQLRQSAQQNPSNQVNWDLMCEATQTLNPSILAFNKLLTKHKVNQALCAPITPLIKYQSDIIAACNDFYSKPVPENAQLFFRKFAFTIFQSKLILTKCYPELAKVKLPLPGVN
jgi:hypothetical protein